MKVKYMQTQVQNDEIVASVEDKVPMEFDSFDEAAKWIASWLDWKEEFLTNLGIRYKREGSVLYWTALDTIQITEVLGVTV